MLPLLTALPNSKNSGLIPWIRSDFCLMRKTSFGINFDGEEAKGFSTVGDIVSYIEKHQAQAAS